MRAPFARTLYSSRVKCCRTPFFLRFLVSIRPFRLRYEPPHSLERRPSLSTDLDPPVLPFHCWSLKHLVYSFVCRVSTLVILGNSRHDIDLL